MKLRRKRAAKKAMLLEMGRVTANVVDDIRAMSWKVAPIARALAADADYCNVCENFPCLGGHLPPA